MTRDRAYRSVIKAVSWRLAGTLDTVLVSLIVTRRIELAVSIGFVELFTKILLYYLHERLWDRIPFGREEGARGFLSVLHPCAKLAACPGPCAFPPPCRSPSPPSPPPPPERFKPGLALDSPN